MICIPLGLSEIHMLLRVTDPRSAKPIPTARSLATRFSRAVAGRDFQTRNQHDIHDLVIVGSIVPVYEHFSPTGGQGDIILVFHRQTASICTMKNKRAEGALVK